MTIHYELKRILTKWFSLKTHTHGDITQDGKIGNDSGKILTTGTNGKIQTSATITKSQISDFPQDIPAGNHTHTFDSITSKPATYPPSTHSHTFDSITGKPNTYTPASHTHGNITNDGKLTATADNINKIVVTEPTTNNIKVINEIPFSKLNITKANITGLGIPSTDTNTTYTAGDGLKLTGTSFSVDNASASDIMHSIQSDSLPNIAPGVTGNVEISQQAINKLFDSHKHINQWEQISVSTGTLFVNQALGLAEYIYEGSMAFPTANQNSNLSNNPIIPSQYTPVYRIIQTIHNSITSPTIGILYPDGMIVGRSHTTSTKTVSIHFLYRYRKSGETDIPTTLTL